MTTTQPKLLTADDLLRLHSEGVRGELIRGVLYETMVSGGEHGEIVVNTPLLHTAYLVPHTENPPEASE